MLNFTRGLYELEAEWLQHMEAVERVHEVLAQLPASDEIRFAGSARRAATTREEAALILLGDTYNWMKFFWYTNVFKARMLIEGLIPAYNTGNYLVWLLMARSTLEYAAVFCYFKCKLDRLDLAGPVFKASHLAQLEEHLVAYAQGTRFNWDALMSGDATALMASKDAPSGRPKAVNILTAITHLSKSDKRFSDSELSYSLLSDFAHPNMASHTAVVDRLPVDRDIHMWRVTAAPGPARGEFMMYLSLPGTANALGKIMEMAVSFGRVVDHWAEMIDNSERVSIDLTQ